jgi:murein DD-endopeptidase MepM/ murein hydrolase activator NlpD
MDFLLEDILEKLTPQFGILTDSGIEAVREATDNNGYFLEVRLAGAGSTLAINTIQEGYVAGKQAVTGQADVSRLVIRTSIKNGLLQRINFGELFADQVAYDLETDLSIHDEVHVGQEIGRLPVDAAGSCLLRIRFFNTDNISIRPAFLLRTLTLLQGYYLKLVTKAFESHSDTAFFVKDYVDFLETTRGKEGVFKLLRGALRDEYDFFTKQFPGPQALAAEYERILRRFSQQITPAELAANYVDLVENSDENRIHYFLPDLSLHFVAMPVSEYTIDIARIKEGNTFSLLVQDTLFQVAINSPVYALNTCEKASSMVRFMRFAGAVLDKVIPEEIDVDTMVKGKFKPRNEDMVTGECVPTIDRFYFAQKTNGDFVHDYKSIKDLDSFETDQFEFAVEHLVGIFKDGLRVGAGHEIFVEDSKTEPDILYRLEPNTNIVEQHGRARMGIPIVALTERQGNQYFVLLVKPDERFMTFQGVVRAVDFAPDVVIEMYQEAGPYTEQWEPIVQFLRDLDVVHAFALDGDDSAGLIYKDDSEKPEDFLKVTPGLKKDGSMPFALTFTKADSNLYPSLLHILQTGQMYLDDFLDLVEKSEIPAAQHLELNSRARGRVLLPFEASLITSAYGQRTPPVHGASAFHLGVDFGVPKGTPVPLHKSGKVHLVYPSPSFGLVVIIYHGHDVQNNEYYSFYSHLDSVSIQEGDSLIGGIEFAVSGDSGSVRTGELMGFDIRVTSPDFQLDGRDDYLSFFRNRPFSRNPQQFLWPDLSQI